MTAQIEINDTELVAINNINGSKRVCRAVVCEEESGGFSVYVADLPGVASQGQTVEEALQNIGEAFQMVLEVYEEDGVDIPWDRTHSWNDRPATAKDHWILVDA